MIEEAGGDGIFQTRVLLLVLLSLVFASLLLYALPFLLLFPQYTCYDHEGVQLASDDCTPTRVANDPTIRAETNQGADTTFANWVQDFNLATENPSAAPTFFLLLFGGLACGGLVMAPIADRWSKKYLLVFGLSTILLVYILVCAATRYQVLLAYVFIYGFALSIVIIAGLLLILQVLPRSSWALVVLYFLAASACVSFYVVCYFRYFTKTWRPLIESACLFLLLFIIFLCFAAESLGHLFEQQRYEELDESLRAISKTNRVIFSGREQTGAQQYIGIQGALKNKEKRWQSSLCTEPTNLTNLVCVLVIFIATLFNYYTITHWMSYLQLDIFLLTTFGTMFDLLGYLYGWALFR